MKRSQTSPNAKIMVAQGGPRRIRLALVLGLISLSALIWAPRPVWATELEPDEFVTAPPGTTALIGYFVYGDHDSYQPVGGPSINHGTHLDEVVGIDRAAEYFDVGGVEALVEFLQPFGTLDNARIAGARYSASTGIGDTIFAAAVWPINDKAAQRYLGVTLYLTVPDGAYNRTETINLGGHRMVYDPEIAFHQGFDKHWSADVSGDFIAYGDNDDAGGALARETLSERPTAQLQGFLNYAWANKVVTSVGYEGERAGRERLDDVRTTAETNFDEVRLVNSYSVTPSFQLLAEVNHQFSNVGGFKQDLGVTLRTLYAF